MNSDSQTARFIVSTDSGHGPPVKGATWEQYVTTEVRTADDPVKCGRPNDGAWWYSEGRNHRLIPAYHKQGDDQWIARDKDAWAWIVDEQRAMAAMRDGVDAGHAVLLYGAHGEGSLYYIDLDHECE